MSESWQAGVDLLRSRIATVEDFPEPGIQFKDISPLLACTEALPASIDMLHQLVTDLGVEVIAAPESRGFLFGVPLAMQMKVGFLPIRKPGKLPRDTHSIEYQLEYGTDTIEMHSDSVSPGQKVLLVDDVLATGGTMAACCELIEKMGGVVVGCAFLMELSFLDGRSKLMDTRIFSILEEQG